MLSTEYKDICRDHLALLEGWQTTNQLLVEKQRLYGTTNDDPIAELQLRYEVEALQREVKDRHCRLDQSWCQLAPLLYVSFLDYREVSGNHLVMAQHELGKINLVEQLEIVRGILQANEAGYLPRFESLYAYLNQPPAGWPHHYFSIRLNTPEPWSDFLCDNQIREQTLVVQTNRENANVTCPIVISMLQELTGLRKRLHTTVVPTSLEHIYKQDDAALFDGPCDVIPMFVADQYELDSIDFHISQLKQRPNNVRRLGMAYQRRQIIAALFDPVIRSLASSDSAIRSIWKEEFYGNLATFYNLENETELYRFSFAPALAITIPYDVYRCPLEQRSGLHYQGMARKEVGELGFFIMEMIDDTQCHIRENRIRFFAQMITAVCGQELVSGGLIDAQHAYKPFCTGIILTNSQMQFYLATRREQLDSHFELYHYANCDLYSVDNRGKCYNIAAFAEAAILFRNQVDMTRRHLRHFQSTGGSSGEADSHAADDGFAAYRQVVTRLAELNPLPEFVATGFARASSRDSIGSVSSIDLDKGVANDGMSIDNDDNANEDDAPCRIIAKKSSISLEKRISQIISDTEELQVLVTNYLRNNNLVAKSVHVHKSNPLCFNRVQRKWDFIAHDGQGRQFFVRLSQNQMANAEQIEMSMRLQRSGVLQGRLIMIRHTGYLLGMQVAVTDYVDQRYDFPQNPYELGYYTSELAKTLAIFHDEFGVCYGNLKPSRVLTVNNSGPLPTILINNIGATHIPTTSTTKELNFTSDIVALGQIAQQHMMSGNMQHTELFDLVQNMLTSISNTRPSMGDIVRQLDVLLPELRKQYKGTEASEFTLLERQLSMHDILDKMSNYSDSSLGLPVCRHSRSMPLKKRDRRLVSQSLLRETKQRRLGESDIFGDN